MLDRIIDFCLEKTVFINLSCTLKLRDKKITLTPLHYALYQGLDELALKLIQWGADINYLDSEGNPPIVYCHLDSYFNDLYYPIICEFLRKDVIFDQNACHKISDKVKIIQLNTDTIIDCVAQFKIDYTDYVKREHDNSKGCSNLFYK